MIMITSELQQELSSVLTETINKCEKFITKVETGKARSAETYNDLVILRKNATKLLYKIQDLRVLR